MQMLPILHADSDPGTQILILFMSVSGLAISYRCVLIQSRSLPVELASRDDIFYFYFGRLD